MLQKLINWLNNMRPKQLMMLAVAAAVLMFVTVFFGVRELTKEEPVVVQQEEQKPPEPEVVKKSVVVAKVNIPPRTHIQESMLEMKELPEDLVPEGVITSFEDVLNVQVKVSIFAGDVLTIQKVFANKAEEGFVGTIPSDCRAISISVTEVTGVAGFAKAGDYVDLILVEKSDYSATSNILLQNVPLLSINQDMGDSMIDTPGSAAVSNPTIATFALQPEDALKLLSASKLGEIYMTLRPANPRSNYVEAMEFTIESINAPKKPQTPTPVIPEGSPVLPQLPSVPATPPVPKIEIIQGDEVVQKAEDDTVPQGANPQLPAIPSAPTNPPAPVNSPASAALDNLPLSNSRVIRGK